MKKLTKLETKLSTLDESTDAADVEKMPTFRHLYRLSLGNIRAASADDARRSSRILRSINTKENEVELAEEDIRFVIQRVEQNGVGMVSSVQGQALERLDADLKG